MSDVLLLIKLIFKLLLWTFTAVKQQYVRKMFVRRVGVGLTGEIFESAEWSDFVLIASCVSASGISVDDLVMQLVGLRYTEPDLTISYPGFLYLLMKLDSMIRKGGRRGRREGEGRVTTTRGFVWREGVRRREEVRWWRFKYGWRQERKKKKKKKKRGGGDVLGWRQRLWFNFPGYYKHRPDNIRAIICHFTLFLSSFADKFQAYDMVGSGAITMSYRQVRTVYIDLQQLPRLPLYLLQEKMIYLP